MPDDTTPFERPDSLSKLISHLSHVPGSGHPAVFVYGGKRLTVDKIVQEQNFNTKGEVSIDTRIVLKEVK